MTIEVRDLRKSFRIPTRTTGPLRERLRHPGRAYRELVALNDVSFGVHKGEFFGIVGRNGSGKSTLLKVLASIYRADTGRVRVAGRLAPFIELGVGMNQELTARENVTLNGVMMGLSRREAARRLDSVLDFAELREFVDLKLKNYSSGMMVRLSFAVMVQMESDVMLIDEVLAVGDASFAEKCLEIFREKRRIGKTIVLVTHDMMTVQAFCDRALVLHDGAQRYVGDPEEAVLRYYRLNFGGEGGDEGDERPALALTDVWLEDAVGERIESPTHGDPFRFNLVAEAYERIPEPGFSFQVLNVDEATVFGFGKALLDDDDEPQPLAPGQRVSVSVEIDAPLVAGRYSILCSISRSGTRGDTILHDVRIADFVIKGADRLPGMVTVASEVQTSIEEAPA
jgi:ABC-type polysaccharide/polyol phosphate transport system ATPase subunit